MEIIDPLSETARERLLPYEDEIRYMVHYRRKSFDQIATYLRQHHNLPYQARTIRRFCRDYGITRSSYHVPLYEQQLTIYEAVQYLGQGYGRNTVQGFLRSVGIHWGNRKLLFLCFTLN